MFALVDCSEILSAPPPLASGIPVKLEPLLPEWCELDCTSVHRLPNEPEERSQWKLGAAAGGPTLSLLTLGFDTCSPLLTIASTATRWTTLRRRAAGIVIAGNGSGRWNSETSFAVRCQVSYLAEKRVAGYLPDVLRAYFTPRLSIPAKHHVHDIIFHQRRACRGLFYSSLIPTAVLAAASQLCKY